MRFVIIIIGILLQSPLNQDNCVDAFSSPRLQSKIPSIGIRRTNGITLKNENDFLDGIGSNNDIEEYTEERSEGELTTPIEFR